MTSHMLREIEEIPAALLRLATPCAQDPIRRLAEALRSQDPVVVFTVARGSSDHMALYLKYAIELTLRLPVASLGPSLVTIHDRPVRPRPQAGAALALALSQSGTSADIVALASALAEAGTPVAALTNAPGSPLAAAATHVIDIQAGPELSVAATKSAVSSLVAGLWLIAHWSGESDLAAALSALPERCAEPPEPIWQEVSDQLRGADRAIVIARGPALGLAQEMALKLIETCGIFATGQSGAEVLHGPSAVLTDGFPVLSLQAGAPAAMGESGARLSDQGAHVLAIPPTAPKDHPLVDPILTLVAFYRMAEALARARGRDPDAPAFLAKATSTL